MVPNSPIITQLLRLSFSESLDEMIIESNYGRRVSYSGLDQGHNSDIVLSFSTG